MSTLAAAPGANGRWWSRRRGACALVLVTTALWLDLGTGGELFARDEPRYAATARHMLESGDWITPVFNGELRYRQPPGIYWLQAASLAVFGPGGLGLSAERAVRLPSVLAAACATAWLCSFLWRRTGSRRAALAAALLFAGSPMVAIEGRAATTDATLVAGLVVLLTALYELYDRHPPGAAWLGWGVLLGLLLLVKGPVPLLVLVATWTVWRLWERRFSRGGPAPGRAAWIAAAFVVALLVALPWAVAVHLRTDGAFTELALGRQLGPRLVSAVEGHGGVGWLFVPWLLFYPAVLAVLAFPASFLVFAGGPVVGGDDDGAELRLRRFLASWLLGPLAGFSLLPTKLFHYALPVVPALVMLAALTVVGGGDSRPRSRWLMPAYVGPALVVSVGPALAAVAAGLDAVVPALGAAAALGLPPLLLGARALARRAGIALLLWSSTGVALVGLVIAIAAGPIFDAAYKAGPPAGRAARELSPADAEVWRWMYAADTLPFYAERIMPLVAEADPAVGEDGLAPFELWASHPEHRWLVLDRRRAEATAAGLAGGMERLAHALGPFRRRGSWEGRFDYEHGRFIDVELWERTPPSEVSSIDPRR